MYRIAVFLPNNLGDVIMAMPVLYGLKKKHDGCHITFFVEDGFEGALENSALCDAIFKFPRKRIRDAANGSDWRSALNDLKGNVAIIKNQQIDYVVNLAQHPYVAYIAALVDAKANSGAVMLREGNISLNDKWSQYLYAVAFARSFNRLHATDVFKRIAECFGTVAGRIELTEKEKTRAASYLKNKGISCPGKNVILQPGTAFQSKRWPIENYTALGKMLLRDGYSLIITGAPSEVEAASEISRSIRGNCCCAAGELTFRETIALISQCEFCVTGDTALMHAASALEKKVYAIFGSTSPVETGPYGTGHTIFSGHCPKRPCFESECASMTCMKAVTPEIVLSAIRGELTSTNHCGCDIYETAFNTDGDYIIQTIAGTGGVYFYPEGAALALRAFDNSVSLTGSDREIFSTFINQCRNSASVLGRMEAELTAFIDNGSADSVRNFESLKQELASVGGIGDFWAALVNIRLNSVPLLDFRKGIVQTMEVCRSTREQMEIAAQI